MRILPTGSIAPCLPTTASRPPSGALWLHEIKHDGFRVIARKQADQVRLYSRPGNDLTARFPLIVEAMARLRSRSCVIDGEAVTCDDSGMPISIASATGGMTPACSCTPSTCSSSTAMTCGDPLEVRKATLASVLAKSGPGIRLNEHMEGDGPTVFRHACNMGLEGIVSKRRDLPYRSGRSPDWLRARTRRARPCGGGGRGLGTLMGVSCLLQTSDTILQCSLCEGPPFCT